MVSVGGRMSVPVVKLRTRARDVVKVTGGVRLGSGAKCVEEGSRLPHPARSDPTACEDAVGLHVCSCTREMRRGAGLVP